MIFIWLISDVYISMLDNIFIHFCCVSFRQNNAFLSSENDGDPEVMLELLARIGQNIMRANELEK